MRAQGKTDFASPYVFDWVAKANGMLPAGFAKLFAADADGPAQAASRDLKVLDAAFAASIAPYNRTFPVNPFAVSPPPGSPEAAAGAEMGGVKAIQKFAQVALQRITASNAASQAYFGARRGPTLGPQPRLAGGRLGSPPHARWMDSLTAQLEDPLGAAVTLSALLSASMALMQSYANADFVNKFANMIDRLGPQPRLIQFFMSLCVVEGRAIVANQELVLREIWLDDATRRGTMLELVQVGASAPAKVFAPWVQFLHGDGYRCKHAPFIWRQVCSK